MSNTKEKKILKNHMIQSPLPNTQKHRPKDFVERHCLSGLRGERKARIRRFYSSNKELHWQMSNDKVYWDLDVLSAYVCQRDSGSEEITPLAPSTIPFLKYSTSLLNQMSLNQLKKVHELAFLQEHLLECGSQYYWKVKYLEIIFSEM